MNMQADVYRPQEYTMADRASVDERGWFLVRTYTHLFGAIMAFVVLEAALQFTSIPGAMMGLLGGSWLIVLIAFMAVSWVANKWAHSDTSIGMQYAGLSLYVIAEVVIFAPLIFMAMYYKGPEVIVSAAVATALIFTGLTAIVFVTRKNFSFMGPFLGVLAMAAMALIVISLFTSMNLGIVFSVAMVVLASGYILYYTSKVLHEYNTHQYVAASLCLFAAVALLFWYVLRIFMSRR